LACERDNKEKELDEYTKIAVISETTKKLQETEDTINYNTIYSGVKI
jgi:hypothetical protein